MDPVEGVGVEVLLAILLGGLFAIGFILWIYFRHTRANRETEEEYTVSENNRPIVYNEGCCPICCSEQTLAVQTNCGHSLCGGCFKIYEESRLHGGRGVNCPMCRQRVGLVLMCFTPTERASEEIAELRNQVRHAVRFYNRLLANELTALERIREIPLLIMHLFRHIFNEWAFPEGFIGRCPVLFFMTFMIAYVISPIDMVSELVYGAYGYIEDAVIVFCILAYISQRYRRFIEGRPQ